MADKNSGKLSFRAIEAFIAVVEEGSVSQGAQRLGASVSAISLQLSNLEKALNTRLVERSAQRFALTEAGHLFRQRALRILDEVDGAITELTTRQESPHFTLRMAVVEDFDNHIMPRWLTLLSDAFPNSRFVVKSGPSHENFTILSSRATDLIVAVDAMDPVDWIEEHPLMRDPYILVTSPSIPANPQLEDLSSFPMVRYAREQHMGRQVEAQLRRVKFVPPKIHEFSSNQTLFSMVLATGGWAISTASAVHGTLSHREDTHQKFGFYKLPMPAFSRTVSLYARKDILSTVPERAATDLRACLREVYHESADQFPMPVQVQVFGEDEI
ncbi:MAG: LysR family transcriptional regulator [Rhizobiaceae bacterium]